jgi:hypothetical protein
MLTDNDLLFSMQPDKVPGVALVWIIDGQCIYDIPTWERYVDMFTLSDEVVDISASHPDHDGITVRFIKDGETVDELQTSEYFGSILLSDPLVKRLGDYPYGRYVISPNATFDGESFTITNREMAYLQPWYPEDGH